MNLLAARVALRPRPLTDVLDLAVPFCRAGWRPLARLALMVLLPALAACLLARYHYRWSWAAVWTLAVVLADLLEGAFTVAHGELLFAEPAAVRARTVLVRFARRLPAYLVALLLSRVALALAALTVVLLPIVPMRLAYVREALLLEAAGPAGAIARSGRISERQHGATAGLIAALLLAPAAMLFGADAACDAIVADLLQLGKPFGDLQQGGTAYALIGFFLSVPITAAARFLKYIDVRTRKEGWDLQLRFAALAAAPRREAA